MNRDQPLQGRHQPGRTCVESSYDCQFLTAHFHSGIIICGCNSVKGSLLACSTLANQKSANFLFPDTRSALPSTLPFTARQNTISTSPDTYIKPRSLPKHLQLFILTLPTLHGLKISWFEFGTPALHIAELFHALLSFGAIIGGIFDDAFHCARRLVRRHEGDVLTCAVIR